MYILTRAHTVTCLGTQARTKLTLTYSYTPTLTRSLSQHPPFYTIHLKSHTHTCTHVHVQKCSHGHSEHHHTCSPPTCSLTFTHKCTRVLGSPPGVHGPSASFPRVTPALRVAQLTVVVLPQRIHDSERMWPPAVWNPLWLPVAMLGRLSTGRVVGPLGPDRTL